MQSHAFRPVTHSRVLLWTGVLLFGLALPVLFYHGAQAWVIAGFFISLLMLLAQQQNRFYLDRRALTIRHWPFSKQSIAYERIYKVKRIKNSYANRWTGAPKYLIEVYYDRFEMTVLSVHEHQKVLDLLSENTEAAIIDQVSER